MLLTFVARRAICRRAAAAAKKMLPSAEMHHLPPFDEDDSPPGAVLAGAFADLGEEQDDELRVGQLVQEIFSFRDSPISNWVVEVSHFSRCISCKPFAFCK